MKGIHGERCVRMYVYIYMYRIAHMQNTHYSVSGTMIFYDHALIKVWRQNMETSTMLYTYMSHRVYTEECANIHTPHAVSCTGHGMEP